MAEVAVNRIGMLLRSMFELLWSKPEGLPAAEIITFLPEIIHLTQNEVEQVPPSKIPRYERTLRLAAVTLFNVGWLTKTSGGRWSITAEGREACRKYTNTQELFEAALRMAEAERQRNQSIHLMTERAEEQAWEQIRSYLLEMNRSKFQSLVVDLLTTMGCQVVWIAPATKDHGQVDMVARNASLNFSEPQILIQVKHKGQPVTVEGLRSFITLLGSSHRGVLFSSGGFTEGVRNEIQKNNMGNLALMDLETFFAFWIKHYNKLPQEARFRLPIKTVHFLGEII